MRERITTAGVLVKDGKFLVARRKSGGAIGERWEFPGGKNRWGESEADTLKREWMEELGVRVEVGEHICSHDFTNKEIRYHLKAYYVSCDDFHPQKLPFHTGLRWVEKRQLALIDFAPSDRHVADFLLKETL